MRTLCRAPRTLAQMAYGRATYYEAGLFGPSGQLVAVLAYDAKRTKRVLFDCVCDHGPAIADLAKVDASDCAVTWQADAWRIGDSGFAVRWTGATELDRAREGRAAA